MKCNDIQLFLIDYLDNELDDGTREQIEAHLATCDKCSKEVKELQMIQDDISNTVMEGPTGKLRRSFNAMLQAEANAPEEWDNVKEMKPKKALVIEWASPLWKATAAVIILLAGVGIGTQIKTGSAGANPNELAEMRKEMRTMNATLQDTKAALMVNMLDDESPSQRIEAVNYAEGIPASNQRVVSALVNTLNTDKNVNVRLAALYSLAKFTDDKVVIDSLVGSLSRQTEPIIQIVLINMLAAKKVTNAKKPIQDIINNGKTLPDVKEIAQKGLKQI